MDLDTLRDKVIAALFRISRRATNSHICAIHEMAYIRCFNSGRNQFARICIACNGDARKGSDNSRG